MIKEDGVYWVAQYGFFSEMEYVKIKMIPEGIELHQRAKGRAKAHHQEKKNL